MNVARRPNSLRSHSHVTVVRDRDDDALTMYTEDNQSFALGSYWDAESDAIPYLLSALGSRDMADGLVTTAWNFGAALGDIRLHTVVSLDLVNPEETHRAILKQQFADFYEDFFGDRPSIEDGVHIDTIAERGD